VLDRAVLVEARAGDAEATDRVARHVLGVALRVAASITGSREQGEDIAQETAILALRSLNSLSDTTRIDAWVARIATRESLRQLRSPARQGVPLRVEGGARASAEPADAAFDRIAASPELRVALELLSPRQRAALALRYVLDLDHRAIARILGCRVGTVDALLSRARTQLRAEPSLSPPRALHAPAEPRTPSTRRRKR
jgi:RNA polymerase sigma factor (sigma-70 family)